ncbi:hypothetical protein Fcan01_24646 [Folsomia candida]|uniref:Uncharacterized protein n=1 Tax=Folsomia candida TaxID=158441 RepID=A0A226D791_FOLCA|nr:hypothetical protein Fcan01_24646 [Folsomia candida]
MSNAESTLDKKDGDVSDLEKPPPPRRRFSAHQGPDKELGKTNLSFVLEESEDEDEESFNHKRHKSKYDKEQEVTKSQGESETDKVSETNNNNNNTVIVAKPDELNESQIVVQKRKESETSVLSAATTIAETTDRRRSSAEIIRQSRAYKRISKALSQVSLYQKEVVYQLQGIEEEVSLLFLFLDKMEKI